MEDTTHTVVKILQRPVKMFSTFINSGVSSEITYLELPQKWFETATNAAKKLDRFAFVRGDFVLRIMLNSQPFQQGLFMVYYWPFENRTPDFMKLLRANNLTAYSGFPHCLIDVATQKSVEFEIPYNSFFNAFPLDKHGSNEFGTIHVRPIAALQSAATTKLEMTIYGYWKNPVVELPTGAPMAQALIPGESNKTTVEGDADKAPPSGSVPILDDMMGTIDAVSNTAGKIASIAGPALSMLGLDKPDLHNHSTVSTVVSPYQVSTDGSAAVTKFTAKHDCVLPPLAAPSGTAADEMSFEFIGRRANVIYPVKILNSNYGADDELLKVPITPCLASFSLHTAPSGTGSKMWIRPTTQCYASLPFDYYRFDKMKIRFQFVKTAFHSARVRAAIHYNGYDANVKYDDNDAYSQVFDIKEDSSFDVVVPWFSPTKWKRCEPTDTINGGHSTRQVENMRRSTLGQVQLSVVNALVHPDTVSNFVSIVTWVSFEGLEFASPSAFSYVPYRIPATTNSRSGLPPSFTPLIHKPQALTDTKDETNESEIPEPIFKSLSETEYAVKLTLGDRMNGLRELTRRYSIIDDKEIDTYLLSDSDMPWENNIDARPLDRYSFTKFVKFLYAYCRGGTRFMITNWENQRACNLYFMLEPADFQPSQSGTVSIIQNELLRRKFLGTTHRARLNDVNFAVEVEVPFYSNVPFRMCYDTSTVNTAANYRRIVMQAYHNPSSSTGMIVSEAGADDFSCHFLIGAPSCVEVSGLNPIRISGVHP